MVGLIFEIEVRFQGWSRIDEKITSWHLGFMFKFLTYLQPKIPLL